MHLIVVSHYFRARLRDAVEAAQASHGAYPDVPLTYRWLAAALGQLGRSDEARAALDMAIEISPQRFEFYVAQPATWH